MISEQWFSRENEADRQSYCRIYNISTDILNFIRKLNKKDLNLLGFNELMRFFHKVFEKDFKINKIEYTVKKEELMFKCDIQNFIILF